MKLNPIRKDMLKEVANIGAGNAATSFSKMIDKEIAMSVPEIELIEMQDLPLITGDEEDYIACVMINFKGEIQGKILIVLEIEAVEKILRYMFFLDSEDELPSEDMQHSALNELSNILSGSYLKAINDFSGLELNQEIPLSAFDMAGAILSSSLIDLSENEDEILLLETEFSLANDKLELFYLFVPEQESLEILFDKLEGGSFV